MLVLDDIARHGIIVILSQSGGDGQVDHWRIAYTVPSLLDIDGAELLIPQAGTPERHIYVFLNLDAIAILL